MGAFSPFSLRMERRRCQVRAFRKRVELTSVADRTASIADNDILVFSTIRNEAIRLPYFLQYYRDLGVGHFLFVDNGSEDGSGEYLADQKDVSLWSASGSYKRSKFGTHWLNWLKFRHGIGHWTLTLDPDEFLVYPYWDTRPLPALCERMDHAGIRSFGTVLIDMYPRGPLTSIEYKAGDNPFELACWFDSGNYTISKNPRYGNLWVQGGPRSRVYFPDVPEHGPSLNKIPLVKWDRRFVYVNSTHMLLPRGLNQTYDDTGGEKTSGCLLHAKFLNMLPDKAAEELTRNEHFAGGREYAAYHENAAGPNGLWCANSDQLMDWRQLEMLGLMSKGSWT